MAPSFPRVGLESVGCKRESPKVPDVGAGDSEGKRVDEMLERRREERGRERSQAGGGVPPIVPAPPLQQGLWTETIKREVLA